MVRGLVLNPVHTTRVHGPSSRAVFTGRANTGNVNRRPGSRPVFTGVKNVNREHGREHWCHFRHPCSLFTRVYFFYFTTKITVQKCVWYRLFVLIGLKKEHNVIIPLAVHRFQDV